MQDIARAERRTEYRRRALMAGTLRFKTRSGTLSCVVRDLSETGAKLVISSPMWIPEQFELEIQHQDMRIDARPVWRGATEMGIAFISKRNEQGRSARAEEKVISLEAERERLQRRVRQLSEEF